MISGCGFFSVDRSAWDFHIYGLLYDSSYRSTTKVCLYCVTFIITWLKAETAAGRMTLLQSCWLEVAMGAEERKNNASIPCRRVSFKCRSPAVCQTGTASLLMAWNCMRDIHKTCNAFGVLCNWRVSIWCMEAIGIFLERDTVLMSLFINLLTISYGMPFHFTFWQCMLDN